ncbi:protein arginine methyltransferase NDUFAF7, mitochondrial-like isoform X2 [Anneissia japonica]|uniref:protein arginine methyltransferase NDUFAF7, mitochondrial-like isoform X2 n=1 Tax=Anneissia japonica TaxID=1529436 RepID=UPI0014256C41|nr:protein arginine methyltransferase NDUFAF7, mitochondrial-like isoform X2 [Anneissia japonica]
MMQSFRRKCIFACSCFLTGRKAVLKNTFSTTNKSGSELARFLHSKIKLSGPISIAQYMKECLTNPRYGYYMHRDVFGRDGDFITSPEISQMFGELIGIWILNEWMQAGSPPRLHIVELGPGRGTLAEDVLRVFSKFNHLVKDVSLHLVEVSPKMRELQKAKLSGAGKEEHRGNMGAGKGEHKILESPSEEIVSRFGIPVTWHYNLNDVPRGFSCFIAHEFFDALPVHIFQRSERGWREILVDIDEDGGPHGLRFVLAHAKTASSVVYINEIEKRDRVEVCPEAGVIIQNLAQRIREDGGSALIADYGHDGDKDDTLRGFKDHKLHDVLSEPGTADLTADVDFSYLRLMSGLSVDTYGPITQNYFLRNMGIETRLKEDFLAGSQKLKTW